MCLEAGERSRVAELLSCRGKEAGTDAIRKTEGSLEWKVGGRFVVLGPGDEVAAQQPAPRPSLVRGLQKASTYGNAVALRALFGQVPPCSRTVIHQM